jgi:hypothetical protein
MKAMERHSNEESLIACYLAGSGLRPATAEDQRELAHLGSCPACAERYRALSTMMTGSAEALRLEADQHFTDARLEHQRERILRHLHGSDVNARILPFPTSPSFRSQLAWPRLATRWVAGAAAAGLLVGLAAGLMMDARRHQDWWSPRSMVALSPSARPLPRPGDAADERFLLEIDEALSSQRAAELQPFDTLTPHVQEIAANFK